MKITSRSFFCFLVAVFVQFALAEDGSPIKLGEPLPTIQYAGDNDGELQIVDGDIEYVPWSTEDLTGKPRIVYSLAARAGIDKIHGALFSSLTELQIDPQTFLTLTLLNGDDVTLGVTGIARSEFAKNKKKYPAGEFVFDADSTAQKAWRLERKSSAVILVDHNGVVLFFKDGELSDAESQQLIELVKEQSGYNR